MLRDKMVLPPYRRFKSGTEWEPVGFFSDALCEAREFDLMLGFFSSSAINVLSYGFATFLYHGGRMRMVINDILSEEDKDAIMVGESDDNIPVFNLKDIQRTKETLSERNRHFFDCLAYLVRHDRLDIIIITPKDQKGISHTKAGIFRDDSDVIAFDGSCNFSRTALVDNIESITVACDWDGDVAKAYIEEIEDDFNKTFNKDNDTVLYESINDVKTRITDAFPDKSLGQLVAEEFKLLRTRDQGNLPISVRKALKRAKMCLEDLIVETNATSLITPDTPHFPYASGPRDYQKQAFINWKNNRQKGLFAMATGTGKTITALNCLLEIYNRKKYYKTIILVPTITLVGQWEEACRNFSFTNIIKVYSKNADWKDDVDRIAFNEKYPVDDDQESYIIIATYASFSRDNTFARLNKLDSRRVLFIADECHNLGSAKLIKRLPEISYGRRIGLSATPERQFDDSGNTKIRRFFGVENEYTFEYTMQKAIENGVLCRYMYYPHLIHLNDVEMEEYAALSKTISKYFNFEKGYFDKTDEILKRLLLKRKRIIHKAAEKIGVFRQIVTNRFEEKGNLKWTLVYVPEGNKPDYLSDENDFSNEETLGDDLDADHLINSYTKVVHDLDESITVRKFVSGQKNREKLLEDFASGRVQVLTSMKCLDEGIDVPRSEMAIFCSSTGNPRQFIQRRGRVLRQHKDKDMAIIHDLVVAPEVGFGTDSYRMEQSLLRGELLRVSNFAQLSENPSFSEMELREVMDYYGLNLSYTKDNDK